MADRIDMSDLTSAISKADGTSSNDFSKNLTPIAQQAQGAFSSNNTKEGISLLQKFIDTYDDLYDKQKEVNEEELSSAKEKKSDIEDQIRETQVLIAQQQKILSSIKKEDEAKRVSARNQIESYKEQLRLQKEVSISQSRNIRDIANKHRQQENSIKNVGRLSLSASRDAARLDKEQSRRTEKERIEKGKGFVYQVLRARSIQSGSFRYGHRKLSDTWKAYRAGPGGVAEGAEGEEIAGVGAGEALGGLASAGAGFAIGGAVMALKAAGGYMIDSAKRAYQVRLASSDVYMGTGSRGSSGDFLQSLYANGHGKRLTPEEEVQYAAAIRQTGGSLVKDYGSTLGYGSGFDRATGASVGTFGSTLGYLARNSQFTGTKQDNASLASAFEETLGKGGLVGLQEESLEALKQLVDISKQSNVQGGNAGSLLRLIGNISSIGDKGLQGAGGAQTLASISSAIANPNSPFAQVLSYRALQQTYTEAGSPLANNTGYLINAQRNGLFQHYTDAKGKDVDLYSQMLGNYINEYRGKLTDEAITNHTSEAELRVNAFSQATGISPEYARELLLNRKKLLGDNGNGGLINSINSKLGDYAQNPGAISFLTQFASDSGNLNSAQNDYIKSFNDVNKRKQLRDSFDKINSSNLSPEDKLIETAKQAALNGTNDAANTAAAITDIQNWSTQFLTPMLSDLDKIAGVTRNPNNSPSSVKADIGYGWSRIRDLFHLSEKGVGFLPGISNDGTQLNKKLSDDELRKYFQESGVKGLNADLLKAAIKTEDPSRQLGIYNRSSGAVGLVQVMPNSKYSAVDLANGDTNIRAGNEVMQNGLEEAKLAGLTGDSAIKAALAWYNGGAAGFESYTGKLVNGKHHSISDENRKAVGAYVAKVFNDFQEERTKNSSSSFVTSVSNAKSDNASTVNVTLIQNGQKVHQAKHKVRPNVNAIVAVPASNSNY